MANDKKQPKDNFPDNMPTGLNMTWWYMDDVETLIASMQLKIDYMEQRLEKTEATVAKLQQKKKKAEEEVRSVLSELKELHELMEERITNLESHMQSKPKSSSKRKDTK